MRRILPILFVSVILLPAPSPAQTIVRNDLVGTWWSPDVIRDRTKYLTFEDVLTLQADSTWTLQRFAGGTETKVFATGGMEVYGVQFTGPKGRWKLVGDTLQLVGEGATNFELNSSYKVVREGQRLRLRSPSYAAYPDAITSCDRVLTRIDGATARPVVPAPVQTVKLAELEGDWQLVNQEARRQSNPLGMFGERFDSGGTVTVRADGTWRVMTKDAVGKLVDGKLHGTWKLYAGDPNLEVTTLDDAEKPSRWEAGVATVVRLGTQLWMIYGCSIPFIYEPVKR